MSVENVTEVPESPVQTDPLGAPIPTEAITPTPAPFQSYSAEVDYPEIGLRCWIRLPNQFQHREIQRRSLAARSRRVAQYKDPESDANVILIDKIGQMEEWTDDEIVKWLCEQHAPEALMAAQNKVENEIVKGDDGVEKLRWPNIREQQDRYGEMTRRGETENDEFQALEKILFGYADAITAALNDEIDPIKGGYEIMAREQLLEKVRRAFIKADCQDEFINAYNQWQIFYGTRNYAEHGIHYFHNFDAVMDAEPEIIEALTFEFGKLDTLKAVELKK